MSWGWLLCFIGRHQWWVRSTWPYLAQTREVLSDLEAVCGRCPAKRYRS